MMQHQDHLKFKKMERNLMKAVSKKQAGSKKLFCQIVVLKKCFVYQNILAENLSAVSWPRVYQ